MSSRNKDASGFTAKQRHKIIVDYLAEINKPTKVFHLRWKPGDLLDGKVLETTPMFWYMKYKWSRSEIEGMFYKARCVIGPLFDMALQQTFGGNPGPRWRGAVPDKKKSKWRERQQEKQKAQWQGQQAAKIKAKEEAEKRRLEQAKIKAEQERLRIEKEKKTLKGNSKNIWDAISDFGADKAIDYQTFSDNLRDRGINVSPLLAKQLFDQLGGPSGKITKQQMDELLKKLDAMGNAANITFDQYDAKLRAMTIMKRVLFAASVGEPFNVDDFVFSSKFGVTIQPIQFMGKLTDRDVPWDDRVRAMESLSANIGSNPLFNNVLATPNIPELLCGWATQILDTKPEVQKTAIDTLPNVFHQALVNGDPSVAIGHLEEILDNLFKVLDDPNSSRNHPAAKKAINKLVDEVVNTADPESVLFLAGLLAEKTDIQNITSAPARAFALEQLQKLMFGANNPYSKFDKKKNMAPIVANQNLPKRGTVNREWLDIGTGTAVGPSPQLMAKQFPGGLAGMDVPWDNRVRAVNDLQANVGSNPLFSNVLAQPNIPDFNAPQSYTDFDQTNMKGKKTKLNKLEDKSNDPQSGVGDDEYFSGGPSDPADPYAHLLSNPTNAKKDQPVTFDAAKSHDCDNEPCKTFVFDFGDGTPPLTTDKPIVKHPYKYPGIYPVSVEVTDKYGKTGNAGLSQRVVDPQDPNKVSPPYAQLSSNPTESKVNQLVNFDASKSHDFKNEPCEHFVFDYGDGSKFDHSKSPKITHRYDKPGVYTVDVEATDKYGQKAKASLSQRVVDPQAPDPTDPYAAVASTPTEPKPNEPVTFDASKSVDCDGDPVKKYVFDFGDGTQPVTSDKPVVKHPYKKPGTFPVKVTVTDKYGKTGDATLTQRVKDPKNPNKKTPPYAAVASTPPDADVDEPVTFDASKSHDFKGDPCELFVFDFGDNTPKQTSTSPVVQHAYKQPGTYPVSCVVTDKFGQSSPASCNQRVKAPPKNDVDDPYVAVHSTPTEAKPKQPVTFDASKSKDQDGDPCKTYVFDFGDGTPPVESTSPVAKHVYDKPGTYPVTVTATDKYGKKGNAKLSQRVKDPKNPNKPSPPYADVTSTPDLAEPNQPVTFDASKSHDQFKKPCVKFEWDFGDNSPKQTTKEPRTKHPYKNPGTYPVKVVVTDKNGLSSQAGLNQKVKNPDKPQPEDPYVAVESTPTNAKPKEPVTVDASKSVDQDGDPCKTYLFDFGDGTPPVESTSPVVNHVYDKPGTYPVKVTATDKYGRKGAAQLSQRVVDPKNPKKKSPPYAHVASTPPEAAPKQPVKFDASKSHDQDGDPCKTFVWDFGDGSPKKTTTTPTTDHTYNKPGVYPVKVDVTDKNGLTSPATLNQRIKKPDPDDPYAAVSSTPTDPKPKEPVKFDASKSVDQDGDPVKLFVFDFGDGTPPIRSTEPVVNHTYDEPGTYPVNVTVTDKNGKKANASLNQQVKDPQKTDPVPPYAHVSSTPPEAAINQPVLFDASKSHDMDKGPCKKFLWDFGDDTPKVTTTEPTVKHPYKKPGTYPVNVKVVDKNGLTGNAGLNQRVLNPGPDDPVAHVASTPPVAKPKEPVTFDASKSHDMDGDPCKNYTFDFGDNSPVVHTPKPVVKHAYDDPGTYPVTVTVTDKYGGKGNASLQQKVLDPQTYSDYEKGPMKGKKYPLNKRRDDQKTDPYTGSGSDQFEPPYAAVTSTPTEAVPKQPVTFDAAKSHDMNKEPCVKFVWDFGDGTPPKTTKDPVTQHPYNKPGTFPVTVQVTDKQGMTGNATCNQRIRPVDVEDPYATVASTPTNPKPKEPVTFDASKSKDQDGDPCKTYVFDFGDGTPPVKSTSPIANHVYDDPGTYPVNVTVTDKYGKKGSAALQQRVKDPKNPSKPSPPYAHVASSPPDAVPQQPVFFDATKSHDQDGDPCKKFVWDFGDNTPKKTTTTPTIQHPYKKPGTYPVTVDVTDKNGLKGQASLNQRIRPIDPEDPYAAVESTPTDPKPKEPVKFDASKSVDQDGDPVKKYIFDFGDGTPPVESTKPVVNHVYDDPGTYPVNVTVVDKYGKKGNAHLNQKVKDPKNPAKPVPPYANVTSAPPDAMMNQPVAFDASKSHDMDKGPCKKFVWNFGDNTPKVTTKEPKTKHPYKKDGVYPVTVTVTDKNGLTATAGLNQRVRKPDPLDPYANVSSTPPDAKPKEPVTFDASKSVDMDGEPCKNFVFDFGDGTPPVSSPKPVVNHAYDKPGTYPVNVTVTDKNGRKGNAALDQRIKDPKKPKAKQPPYANVSSTPPDALPRKPVTFDASKSHDMDKQPCKKFVFDFGDGTKPLSSNKPVVKHSYAQPGVYPVTVEVTDKYNQKGTASLQQRVTDPAGYGTDPSSGPKGPNRKKYGGRKGNPSSSPSNPVGNFGSSGNNDPYGSDQKSNNNPSEYKDDPNKMSPQEIGDEFRNIAHDAVSNAILDPNMQNSKDGKKLTDVMSQLSPNWSKDLEPEAAKRYGKWKKKPMKPTKKYGKPLPRKPLPAKPGVSTVHNVQSNVTYDIKNVFMPDI